MDQIKESDWKQFGRLREVAYERYCERVLDEIRSVFARANQTEAQRYDAISDLIKRHNKEAASIFGDFRRSTAKIYLLRLCAEKLITPAELATFSLETQELINGLVKIREEPLDSADDEISDSAEFDVSS